MAEITHGVSTSKTATSVSTPNVAASGIIFAVGTAPVQQVGGKVHEVIMANTYEEAAAALGYSDKWKKYGLAEVIYTAFQLYQTAPVFLVNVLDPTKHKKAVSAEKHTVEDNQIKLPLEAIAESVAITGKTAGTDFEVFYDDTNCVIEFLTAASGEISVNYNAVDPSR
jgi:hypothetical protein